MPSWNLSEPEKILIIGSSTGGPGHIQKIAKALPDDYNAAVVIAQHIDNPYIPSFVKQLQKISRIKVEQVSDNLFLSPGTVYVCAHHSTFCGNPKRPVFGMSQYKTGRYNPDIDALLMSAQPLIEHISVMVLILTGIGDDGADGCSKLAEKGARCIAESESSAIVYGMPLQAKLKTENIEEQSLDEIINTVRIFGKP